MNGHSDVVGAEEDGTISFNEDTHCYEEVDGKERAFYEEVDGKERAIRFYNYIYEYCYGIKNTDVEFDNPWFGESEIVDIAFDLAHYNDCDVCIVTLDYNDWKENSNG